MLFRSEDEMRKLWEIATAPVGDVIRLMLREPTEEAIEGLNLAAVQSKGLSRVFSNTTVQKHQIFGAQLSFQLSHPYMTTGKTIALTRQTFVGKVMSLIYQISNITVINEGTQARFNRARMNSLVC